MICAVGCLIIVMGACRGTPEENVTKVNNGPFKILVRSQEFHHSAIRNIDICIAETASRNFPKNKLQCFLRGFDFSGLSANWQGQREIEVSFRCGRVTYFTNTAFVYTQGPVPVESHVALRDGCGTGPNGAQSNRSIRDLNGPMVHSSLPLA